MAADSREHSPMAAVVGGHPDALHLGHRGLPDRIGDPGDDQARRGERRNQPGPGLPRLPRTGWVKRAAIAAIEADINQYPITWGQPSIRQAIADEYRRCYGMDIDPDREISVTCGATEAMIAAMIGCVDRGEEVIVFEPFYENYGPDAIIAGAVPALRHPPRTRTGPSTRRNWRAAFNGRTRAIIINNPQQPHREGIHP